MTVITHRIQCLQNDCKVRSLSGHWKNQTEAWKNSKINKTVESLKNKTNEMNFQIEIVKGFEGLQDVKKQNEQ